MTRSELVQSVLAGIFLSACAIGGWIVGGIVYFS